MNTSWRDVVLIMDKHIIVWKEFVDVHEALMQLLNKENEKELPQLNTNSNRTGN